VHQLVDKKALTVKKMGFYSTISQMFHEKTRQLQINLIIFFSERTVVEENAVTIHAAMSQTNRSTSNLFWLLIGPSDGRSVVRVLNYAAHGKVSCRSALWRTAAECHLKLSDGPLNY
jgi:hypothetical protein